MKTFIKAAFFSFVIGTIISITGCTQKSSISIPTPEIGKSSLMGYIIDNNGMPLKDTTIRLAEVYRENENDERGAYILDTAFSPGTISDANGFFLFKNIAPNEYVIVVGDIENNNYEIISQENGRPKVWRVIEGQILDIGKLKINIPSS